MGRLVVVVIVVAVFVVFVVPRLVLVVVQFSGGVPAYALVAGGTVCIIHDEFAAAEDWFGIIVAIGLVSGFDSSAAYLMRVSLHV